MRRKTKEARIGYVRIGGGHRVAIQSMTNTRTSDTQETARQINELENLGCDIIRVGIPDMDSAKAISEIKKSISIPLVADIHFDYRLAIGSIMQGADKIRINPGNFPKPRLEEMIRCANDHDIAIRIGVNMGSLDRKTEQRYGRTPEAMVRSALGYIDIFERNASDNIVVSLKASGIRTTVEAYTKFSEMSDYPLHIGITEAGTPSTGSITSAVGLGTLLYNGIGDTMRVSLSGDPAKEIPVAYKILKSLGLRKGVKVTCCPTCARTRYDVAGLAEMVEDEFGMYRCEKRIAVMGCEVNGPGEAKDADIAVVGTSKGSVYLYQGGERIREITGKNAKYDAMEAIREFLGSGKI